MQLSWITSLTDITNSIGTRWANSRVGSTTRSRTARAMGSTTTLVRWPPGPSLPHTSPPHGVMHFAAHGPPCRRLWRTSWCERQITTSTHSPGTWLADRIGGHSTRVRTSLARGDDSASMGRVPASWTLLGSPALVSKLRWVDCLGTQQRAWRDRASRPSVDPLSHGSTCNISLVSIGWGT